MISEVFNKFKLNNLEDEKNKIPDSLTELTKYLTKCLSILSIVCFIYPFLYLYLMFLTML